MDLFQQISYNLCKDIYTKQDALLKDIISAKLGRTDWAVEEILERLDSFVYKGEKRVITIDGEAVLEFYEPKSTSVGHRNYVVTSNYRILYNIGKDLSEAQL